LLVVLIAAGVDLLLAPSTASLSVDRLPIGSVPMGSSAESVLAVQNTSARSARGVLRDAWQPTAGAGANRHRFALASGARMHARTTLTPRRRGDLHALGVTIRL